MKFAPRAWAEWLDDNTFSVGGIHFLRLGMGR
jgi:hypothetical protein